VVSCEVRPNTSRGPQHSRFIVQLSGDDAKKVKKVVDTVRNMVVNHPTAEGSVHIHSTDVSFFVFFLSFSK
jgi:hypothetical protein